MNRAQPEIERWKGALVTLPDESFFEIVRNYLGELRTPFNKHSLIEELVAFARRGDTIERILQLVDEQDARLLTALELLREPDIERLFSFFGGTMSYLELYHCVLNLEERLLVYRERARGPARLLFTPLLREKILERIVDPSLLFPSFPIEPNPSRAPWLTEFLVIALFSHFLSCRVAVRNDGSLKKRSREELAAAIPLLAAEGRIESAVGALKRLSLLREQEGSLLPEVERWRSLAEIDSRSRAAILWSAALWPGPSSGGRPAALEEGAAENGSAARPAGPDVAAPSVSEAEIYRRALIISGVVETMRADRAYPAASVEKIAVAADTPGKGAPLAPLEAAAIVEGMASLGILLPVTEAAELQSEEKRQPGRGQFRGSEEPLYRVNPAVLEPPSVEERTAVAEPNFLVTVKPSVRFEAGISLGLLAELRHFDVYSRFEITKKSFLRALEHDLTSTRAEELFEGLSGSPLPQNLRFTLASWQRELEGISLSTGVVLTADSERRHLIEHSEALQPYLKRMLAPGVYLLDPHERREWEEALRRAGINPLPAIRSSGGRAPRLDEPAFRVLPATLPLALRERGKTESVEPGGPASQGTAAAPLRSQLLRELEGLSVPEEQKGELIARINKKLILYPSQLGRLAGRLERSEAKGLDYVGKIRLIEQALGSDTELLEILERQSKGETRRLLVKPLRLEKVGNDLLLGARTLPEEADVEIKVRKMGLVRKLRGSLFAP